MKRKKRGSMTDKLMAQVEISQIERTKCRGSGKVSFRSYAEAKFFMYWMKWRYRKRSKSRKSYRLNKPRVRYIYACDLCEGYHLTKIHPAEHEKNKKKWEAKYFNVAY